MERLTKRPKVIVNGEAAIPLDTSRRGLVAILNRLAAYEDTGLEPEEVDQIRRAAKHMMFETVGDFARYAIANFEELESYRAIGPSDLLRVLVKADQDGRLVVLPCKIGDMLYRKGRYGGQFQVYEFCIDSMYIVRGDISIFANPIYNEKPCTSYTCFYARAIGKTVFLTREEAEAALDGGNHETDSI